MRADAASWRGMQVSTAGSVVSHKTLFGDQDEQWEQVGTRLETPTQVNTSGIRQKVRLESCLII